MLETRARDVTIARSNLGEAVNKAGHTGLWQKVTSALSIL